ncbi:interferon-induced protein 44-like isoform X3 [Seriola lalandi dorsalis]|uniref:interferon-induced protein 44-like isoform X3 n=1 Tax=Seriola lalandi dorsalis TaxID=1841481 RepID=UPI000C6FB804|nr:interferon-induced protein 44-like isoform X3 [Seriola lalandi dorsalis]
MEGRLVDKLNKLTLDQPWRAIFWGDKQRDLQYVQEYKPENGNVSHLRVLLYGPVGAGKSSFINSVSNVLRGRMTIPTLASATTSNTSFTRRFNPLSPLSERDPGYNPTPSPDDRVHILVCVFSANSAEIKGSVLQKMKAIRETASDLAIPQMAIVTNIDAACAEIEKDLKNVYMSKHLKKKMTDFSSAVGIPMNCICPVKNYSQEIQINDEVDSLIVSALRLIIDFGDDFIDNMQTSPAGQ